MHTKGARDQGVWIAATLSEHWCIFPKWSPKNWLAEWCLKKSGMWRVNVGADLMRNWNYTWLLQTLKCFFFSFSTYIAHRWTWTLSHVNTHTHNLDSSDVSEMPISSPMWNHLWTFILLFVWFSHEIHGKVAHWGSYDVFSLLILYVLNNVCSKNKY